MHVSRSRARFSLAWVVLFALLGVAVFANARGAIGDPEGVFTLHLNKYEVVEGETFDVTVIRSNGATLAQDVTVTLKLCVTTEPFIPGCNQALIDNVDFPTETLTQTAVFTGGTNQTQQTVRFQSLNRSRIYNTVCGDGIGVPPTIAFPAPVADCTLTTSVVIHSVDFGSIGTPDWSPLLIRGRGAPIVNDIFPHSGATGSFLQIHGANFQGININGKSVVVDRVEFRPRFGGGLIVYTTACVVNSPTLMTVTVPAGLVDATTVFDDSLATYDVVVVSRLDDGVPPIVPACDSGGPHVPDGSYCNGATPPCGQSLIVPKDQYIQTSGATVNGLSKRTGPTQGGTELRVFGTGFVAGDCIGDGTNSLVFFEGAPVATANCTFISPTELLVVTPPSPLGFSGLTNVRVRSEPIASPATVDNEFTYAGAPKITAISPAFGPTSGGTTVEIIGTGFLSIPGSVNAVAFGGTPAGSFTVHSDTRITAVSPPLIADVDTPVQIRVTHPATGTSPVTTAATFTYVVGPLITSLSPSSGPPQGGTFVTISGNGFAAGATVSFGNVVAPFANVESPTRILVTSPAGSGVVDVKVTIGSKSTPSTPQSKFQYAVASITAITPNAGPTAGGTQVVIEGTNFQDGSKVRFGEVVVDAVFVTPLMIMATTPPMAAGEVNVVVETPSGNSGAGPEAVFTYTDGPIVSGLNPNTGPTSGGTIVIISGSNFADPVTVTFGGIVAPAASYNSGTGQVTALAPAAPGPGPVDVRVSTALGSSPVSDAAEFTYLAAKPVITEISPNTGSVFGGDVVTIRGVGFLGTVCPGDILFGTQVVQSCTVVNDTTIQLTTPAGQSGPTVVVITSANGTSDIVELFTYTKVTGGGGGGGGGGGAGDGGTPQPGTGEQVSYLLYPGWNTVTWRGPDDIAINAALADADGNSLEFAITEIHVLNMDTSTYLIYAPAQSMFQFGFLQRDTVYWFRNTSNVVVTLVTTDQ